MSPGRRLAALAVAYNVGHHLGALPGGLGSAGGATRWVDWLDLLTPYAVVGLALAVLAAAGTDRRGWWTAAVGGVAYAQGHGVHLAANSIGNARGEAAPVHLWDEVLGHWLWYAGAALLVVAVARAVQVRSTPVALSLALVTGATWTTNALEGTTAAGSFAVAVGLSAWAVRRRDVPLLVAFGLSALLLGGWGAWHGGWPAPSSL